MTQRPRKPVVILLSVLSVFALAILSQDNEPQEENAVYLAMLVFSEHSPDLQNAKYLSSPAACRTLDIDPATVPNPLLTAFTQANDVDATPIRLPALKSRFNVIDWAETRRLNNSKNIMEKVHSTEAGFVMLSRVGFDASRNQALVCIESQSRGVLYVLHKEADTWVVDSMLDEWIK